LSPRPNRRFSISDLRQRIITTAWQQIAAEGAPALSLRAIARALNISAPAIYNYFPDRDGLVTALIVEAFTSFGDAQAESIAAFPAGDHASRLRALGLAYRQWAITYPERYQLIFGTPIAGYHAPVDIIMPAAACSLEVLVGVLADANAAGRLQMDHVNPITPPLESMLKNWQPSLDPDILIEVLFIALVTWGRVHGLVSLEISNQFPPFIIDAGEIYRREVERIVIELIRQEK
jgi:AcrR family transcriptional regulator